jgi:murein DD-endopeptidase MepM/ murein hydrolase activator NlpD
MRFKWLKNRLTFLIIPEANDSVVRVKLSHGALCAMIFSILLLLGTASYVQIVYVHSLAATQWTETRIKDQTHQLQQDLSSKNNTIEQLHNEVFQLSRQADQVRSKMEEMKVFEHDLTKLSSFGEKPAKDMPAAAMVQVNGGMGGPPHPVTVQQVQILANMTSAAFTTLQQELDELKQRFLHSQQALMVKRDSVVQIPSLWPTLSRTVTSPFGYRKDPFNDKLSFHRGIDIAGKFNDPVHASANGIAITVGYDKFHGHHIVLEHHNGFRTWYMHLSSALVHMGEPVKRGQQIGRLGSSGRSTGPHLHYEIIQNGKSTNPKPYLPSS